MLRFLAPLIAFASAFGHAVKDDSDGGKHITRAELKELGNKLLGIAEDAAQAPVGLGDTVLVRIGGTDQEPVLRPAIVVRVWGGACVNLQVFLDGTNDAAAVKALTGQPAAPVCILWRTSVGAGMGVDEWRRA